MPTPDLRARLRLEVGRFRERERRRTSFDPLLHVGVVAGDRVSGPLPDTVGLDRALRIEVLVELLGHAPDAVEGLWVTRPGPPALLPPDADWVPALTVASEIMGRSPGPVCHAVTRHGWVDLRTGESRVWRRLRL